MKRIKLTEDGLYTYPLSMNVIDSGGKSLIDRIADRLTDGRQLPVRLGRPSFDGSNLADYMYEVDNMLHVGNIVKVDGENVVLEFNSTFDPNDTCLDSCNNITILMLDCDAKRIAYCGFLYPDSHRK